MIHTDDPVELWAEVDKAFDYTKKTLAEWPDIQKQWGGGEGLAGQAAHTDGAAHEDHENVAFGFGAWMLANLLHGNPRVKMESTKAPEIAMAGEAAVNRWIHQENLRVKLEQNALDHTLIWGVGVISNEEDPQLSSAPTGTTFKHKGGYQKHTVKPSEAEPEHSATPSWPTFQRIPQERYGRDPVALEVHLARFETHKWIRERAELLKEAETDSTWHKDVIEDYITPDNWNEDEARADKDVPNRDELEAIQIWVKDYELEESEGPDKGFHGTIFTIVNFPRSAKNPGDMRSAHLRDPIPFYGPPWGPYVHFGVYPISNESFPMSPIVAVKKTVDRLNRIDKAMARGAEDYKRPILYDLKDGATAKALQSASDHQFIGIPNFDKNKVLMGQEMGGIDQQQIVWRNDCRSLVDRVLGFTDMQRGAATEDVSATQSTLAAGNADTRAGYIKQKWVDAVERLLSTVAWYILMSEDIYVPLEGQAAKAMGVEPGVGAYYQGGDLEPRDWARIDLKITPFSMERTDEGARQRAANEMAQMFINLPPMIAQFPMLPWTEFLRLYGDMKNMPELERLLPPEVVAQIGQMGGMMQQQQGGGQAQVGSDLKALRPGGSNPKPPGLPGVQAGNAAAGAVGVR